MNIIGQRRLLNIIESYYNKNSLPKTLMFIGPLGCGKHTITKFIANKFELDFVEIDESVSAEDLDNYLYSTIDTMYLIDLSKFQEKQQNQFLKFIEEPSKSVYVTLISNSESGILNTVLNRCTKHYFDEYTKDQIEQIMNTTVDGFAFEIFKTPGKLLSLTNDSFKDIIELANNIIHNIDKYKYSDALANSTKINYKDLYNKVDFNLFFDAIEYLALDDFKKTGSKQSLLVFTMSNKFKQYATQANIIKEALMLNYLTTLWEAIQNDISRT